MFGRIGLIFFIGVMSLFLNDARAMDPKTTYPMSVGELSQAIFEEILKANPEFATFVGRKEFNALWTDYSEQGYAERYNLYNYFLKKLNEIEPRYLSVQDHINYDLLLRMVKESIRDYEFKLRYLPLNQLSGVALEVDQVIELMPQETLNDYENILARLEKVPEVIDQTIKLLAKGLEENITPPQICLRLLPMRLSNLISQDPEASPFYRPFTHFPENFSKKQCDNLTQKALITLKKGVYPAYEKLVNYVKNTYLPRCRTTTNMADLPQGEAWYKFLVETHTTTELSPKEIHDIGLTEVARIQKEMDQIIAECSFASRGLFMEFLHHDPQFFYKDGESLVQGYRDITKFIEGQLPKLFGKIPSLPYEVLPVPKHSEQSQVGAYYMPGSVAAGRPGRFYANTYDLPTRPKWQMDSLALHEAIPGHHFQISIAQEVPDMPEFRKYTGYTAYIEGWALYAESLGSELGLYQTPYSKFGRLVEEMWRAVRLVVDTGMHSLGWSRDQAIAYFMEKTSVGEREATTEIDRYLVWPGQALAYKVGELTIKRWREMAQKEMGSAFDIRDFHDLLLRQGALPLNICEQQIDNWIKEERSMQVGATSF